VTGSSKKRKMALNVGQTHLHIKWLTSTPHFPAVEIELEEEYLDDGLVMPNVPVSCLAYFSVHAITHES
jgi:hypothetical protein